MSTRCLVRARGIVARTVVLVVAVLLLLGVATGRAQAHAVLESSIPAQGSVLPSAPDRVQLHFDEPVEISLGSLRVLDGDGKPVEASSAVHPGGRGSDIAVGLKSPLAPGTYLVLWRVVSADSHPVSGTFTFSIGHPGTVATATGAASDGAVGAVFAAARLLGYLGLAAFLGGIWFLLGCWPDGVRVRASRRIIEVGWALAMVGTASALLLEGPYGAGLGLADTLDGRVLRGVLDTRYGHGLIARLGLLVLAAVLGWWTVRTKDGRRRLGAIMFSAAALATLATFSYTGHAGVGGLTPLSVLSDIAHLTAMSVWIGGLLQLAVAVLGAEDLPVAVRVATRFSTVALTSVVVLAGTGIYQAWRQAGILGALTATHYGELLLIKIGVVGSVLVVAGFSRRWVRRHRLAAVRPQTAPIATAAPQPPPDPSGKSARRSLQASVGIEAGLTVVVLAITALLVAAPPARSAYRPATAADLTAGPVTIQLSVVPTGTRVLDIHLYTFSATGQTLPVPELDAQLSLPARNIGPIVVTLAKIGDAHFIANAVQLPYAGEWMMTIKARTSEFDAYTTSTKVTVR